MKNTLPDSQFGEFGEQEVRARLERALHGTGVQFSGFADKGIDLLFQFPSSAPENVPLHFGVQVKTGNSYTEDLKTRWKVKNITEERFNQWRVSRLPIIFVWVRPTNPAECYWKCVRKNAGRNYFLISKHAIIAPTIKYDLALEYFTPNSITQEKDLRVLRPRLAKGLRPYAKEYYRSVLMHQQPVNPLLGKVKFTWAGWKHISSHSRPVHYVHQSLEFLSAVTWAIENPSEFVGIRRIGNFSRGAWTTEIRLLVFATSNVQIASRSPANLVVVIRERISYPNNWMNNVNLHKDIRREISFESVYEKPYKK